MATRANQDRTRIIRSVILSASIFSIVPLIGLMQHGQAGSPVNLTASLDTMAVQPDIAASTPTSQPTSTAVSTTSKSTSNQKTTQSSYTRTKAS